MLVVALTVIGYDRGVAINLEVEAQEFTGRMPEGLEGTGSSSAKRAPR